MSNKSRSPLKPQPPAAFSQSAMDNSSGGEKVSLHSQQESQVPSAECSPHPRPAGGRVGGGPWEVWGLGAMAAQGARGSPASLSLLSVSQPVSASPLLK